MELNLFTLIAQIINFLVLVWLLKKFLYGPIVSAMQTREDKIRERLESAEKREKDAEAEKTEFQNKQKELDSKKEQILEETKREAAQQKKESWEKARAEVDEQQQKWLDSVSREKDSFLKELRQRITRYLSDTLRKSFRDLANEELEQQILSVFLNRLERLDDETKRSLSESIRKENSQTTVRSAFAIPEEKQKEITDAIHRATSSDAQVHFEVTEDLVAGIEVRSEGRKIAWNVDEYVQEIQKELDDILSKEIARRKEAESKEPPAEAASSDAVEKDGNEGERDNG